MWCVSAWNDNGKEGYVNMQQNGELRSEYDFSVKIDLIVKFLCGIDLLLAAHTHTE